MRMVVFAFLFLLQPAPATDQERLQGEWRMIALDVRESLVPAEKLKGTTLTIKDDKYIVKAKKTNREVTFKLDSKQNPKHIDMFFPDGPGEQKLAKGIYKIDGDKLIICRGQAPGGEHRQVLQVVRPMTSLS